MTWTPTPPTWPGRYHHRARSGGAARVISLVQDLVGPGLVHGTSRVRAEELGGEWGGPADEATRRAVAGEIEPAAIGVGGGLGTARASGEKG